MTTRASAVCVSGVTEVAASVCAAAGLSSPPSSRACNTFPCPASLRTWHLGEWSACMHPVTPTGVVQTCLPGTRTRSVACVDGSLAADVDGAAATVVDPLECGAVPPPSSTLCAAATPVCACATDVDCVGPVGEHSLCDRGACACAVGWTGVDCSIPQLFATSEDVCVSGVVDVSGRCCSADTAVNATGFCCPPASQLDAHGSCCSPPLRLDACGVCGGSSVGVDVRGTCCRTPLAASGLCCQDDDGQPQQVDACGVCGGVDDCNMAVSLSLTVDVAVTPMSDVVSRLADMKGAIVSAVSMPSEAMFNVSLVVDGSIVAEHDTVTEEHHDRLLANSSSTWKVCACFGRCLVPLCPSHPTMCCVYAATGSNSAVPDGVQVPNTRRRRRFDPQQRVAVVQHRKRACGRGAKAGETVRCVWRRRHCACHRVRRLYLCMSAARAQSAVTGRARLASRAPMTRVRAGARSTAP